MADSSDIDRAPAVAGQFYPANPNLLSKAIDEAFASATQNKESEDVRAIIVPHAGYVFSAKVAASGFKKLRTSTSYEHIFLIGSSHVMSFEGASVFTGKHYITPLGKVNIDPLAKELVEKSTVLTNNLAPHLKEHSLEVEIPFLQKLYGEDLSIIPIIIGTNNKEVCEKIAKELTPYFTDKNIFVISSDFSHYPDDETARMSDSMMFDAIAKNSPEKFLEAKYDIEQKKFPGIATAMCGWTSALTLLYITSQSPDLKFTLLDTKTSGDSEYGDKNQVVGYMSISITSNEFHLSESDKHTLLKLARRAIELNLQNKHAETDSSSLSFAMETNCGAFVSLYVDDDLRGCIGTFRNDRTLYKNVIEMAASAATSDYRFIPLKTGELNKLHIEISVLTPMRKVASINEIQLGKHGIYIHKGSHHGTFLPQVAEGKDWTVEDFLGYCARDKANIGWDGWRNAEIFTYEAIVFKDK